MVLSKFMENFARELHGEYSQYDQAKSVMIVPLEEGRLQTVLGLVKIMPEHKPNGITFSSMVCNMTPEINLADVLRMNTSLCYARFVIEEGGLKVQPSALMDQLTEALLKEIIPKVAPTADAWEYKLTG